MHTEITLLANAYMEIFCWDMWEVATKRHWSSVARSTTRGSASNEKTSLLAHLLRQGSQR